ncbi:MAG: 50S ribosomal protein L32 [bacterium]|nr:50S ribosomal protein L32 [bacterium]
MAPVPKNKPSTARSGKRRLAIKAILPGLVRCPSCKALKRPHIICPHCGYHHRAK